MSDLRKSVIFDAFEIGILAQLSAVLPLRGRRADDFQRHMVLGRADRDG